MSPRAVPVTKGTFVVEHDGEKIRTGRAKGAPVRPCKRQGCKGFRFGVYWFADGVITFPCTSQVKRITNGQIQIVAEHPENKRRLVRRLK